MQLARNGRFLLFGSVAFAVVAASIGWTLVQERSSVSDPVFTRDRMTRAPALTAESVSSTVKMRLISFADGRWVLTSGEPGSEVLVAFTGRRALYRVTDSCFATSSDLPQLPFVPGVTAVRELESVDGRVEEAGTISYQFESSTGVVRYVSERLAGVASDESYMVTTAYDSSRTSTETFVVRESTAEEIDVAMGVFLEEPSRLGSIVLQPRLLMDGFSEESQFESQAIIIADCPEVPAYPPIARPPLTSGALAGTIPFQLRVVEGKYFVEDVWLVEAGIGAPVEDVLEQVATVAASTFPLEGGATYAVKDPGIIGTGTGVALFYVVACGPDAIIRCPPAD